MTAAGAAARHGVVGVHFLEGAPELRDRMDVVRAVGRSDARAARVLLVEATREDELTTIRRDALAPARLAERGLSEEGYGVYRLLHEVARNG